MVYPSKRIKSFKNISTGVLGDFTCRCFLSSQEKKNEEVLHFNVAFFCRPLPEEALFYSRDDTHYLLCLYDVLRNELITKSNGTSDLLMKVYYQSTELCRKVSIEIRLKKYSAVYDD